MSDSELGNEMKELNIKLLRGLVHGMFNDVSALTKYYSGLYVLKEYNPKRSTNSIAERVDMFMLHSDISPKKVSKLALEVTVYDDNPWRLCMSLTQEIMAIGRSLHVEHYSTLLQNTYRLAEILAILDMLVAVTDTGGLNTKELI